jgi:hypothetical protein
MDEETVAPEAETPSGEGVPSDDDATEGTTPDEGDGGEDPADDEADPNEDDPEQASEDGEDDPAWEKFQRKFAHIKDDRARKAAMGKAWWEKNNFASQRNKEAERLARENEELRSKLKPPAEEKPAAPHPDLVKAETRIQSLVAEDTELYTEQQDLLPKLQACDKEIVKWQTKAEDATDDYAKAQLELKAEQAQLRKDTLLARWKDIGRSRVRLSKDVEGALADKNWVEQFIRDEAAKKGSDADSERQFNEQFPRYVDSQIQQIAKAVAKADLDPDLMRDLRATARDQLTVALMRLDERGVSEANVPKLLHGYISKYLGRIDLAGRTKFTDASRRKLAVAGRATPVAPPRPTPAAGKPKGPVPVGRLQQGDLTPAMSEARKYLASRGL